MPVYEYECRACRSHVSILFRSFAAASTETPICTACGSKRLKRLLSTSTVLRAHASTIRREATPQATDDSPEALARAMREAVGGRDMGNEFNEVAARLEKGESPKTVEKSLRKRAGQKRGTH